MGPYKFPELTLRIHLWQLTKEVDSKGYYVTKHNTIAVIRYSDVFEFQMKGFNQQNAIFELSIERRERSQGPSPYFFVELVPAFGIDCTFECSQIEVLEAVPHPELDSTL